LFIEKGSKGITVFRAPEPPKAACRIAISTSAEVPFVRTLSKAGSIYRYHSDAARVLKEKRKKEPETGNEPGITLGDGTRSAVQRGVELRYRRWDIARMMKELDLK